MNKDRREKIKIISQKLLEIKKELDSVQRDEEFAFDSMPEGLQSSDRGVESEDAIDAMDNALSNIDDAIDHLQDVLL